MLQTICYNNISLHDLKTKFGLQRTFDKTFFPEWQLPKLTEITPEDRAVLDRVRDAYFNLIEYPPLLEDGVKMVILAPLLNLTGFFLHPFHIKSKYAIKLITLDKDLIIEGKIDILILKDQLWIMVIGSKQATFSIEVGLAQILAYMLASNTPSNCFGMIAIGSSFVFVKLVKAPVPCYALSQIFALNNPRNELYNVLAILRHLECMALSDDLAVAV